MIYAHRQPNHPRHNCVVISPHWHRWLVCGLLTFLTTAACDRKEPSLSQQRGSKIVFIGPYSGHAQAAGIHAGARAALERAPLLHAEFLSPVGPAADDLAMAVDAAIRRQPAVICLFVENTTSADDALRRLQEGGALTVTFGPEVPDPRATRHVQIEVALAAEQLGAALAEIAGERRSYVLVHSEGVSPVTTQAHRRFRSAERSATLTLLREFHAGDSIEAQMQVIAEALDLFRHCGVLVTLNPAPWLHAPPGWLRELREINTGFRFATLSAAPVLWAQLGTPEQPGMAAALVGPLDTEVGAVVAELAVALTLRPEAAGTNRTIPTHLVTAGNLREFAARYAAAGLGFDPQPHLPGAYVPGVQAPPSSETAPAPDEFNASGG